MNEPASIAKAKAAHKRELRAAALAQLPRLIKGATAWAFLNFIILKCDGRTPPLSAEELTEACGMKLRAVQRQLSELKQRGIIEVSYSKPHGHLIRYTVSLPYSTWAGLEEFRDWKRKQKFLGGWANTGYPAS